MTGISRIGSLRWDLRPGTLDKPGLAGIIREARANGLRVETFRTWRWWIIRCEHAVAQGPEAALLEFQKQLEQLEAS